jgi:hypothetical protein
MRNKGWVRENCICPHYSQEHRGARIVLHAVGGRLSTKRLHTGEEWKVCTDRLNGYQQDRDATWWLLPIQ